MKIFIAAFLNPNLFCLRFEGIGGADVHSEDDQGTDSEHDPPYWQQLVGREVLAGLMPQEIKRQEVINGENILELFFFCLGLNQVALKSALLCSQNYFTLSGRTCEC